MRYKFDVSIHRNKIDDPIAERYPPPTFSPRYFINVLADNLATISPALKNTITSPVSYTHLTLPTILLV